MIEIHGKPFLEYLVEMLGAQGFERILLLLGYRAEVIQGYFGDGHRWGVQLEYSVTSVESETGRRLKRAEARLDDCFLLMYCDNYWPMQIDRMWSRFVGTSVPAMVTVYRNRDAYTKACVRVDAEGYVTVYDKTRQSPSLEGVEIGYALLEKSVIESLPPENVSFEATVYPRLAEERRLLAYLTDHRYYSIGSPERLPLTEAFLSRRPAVLLDRDGVLNRKPARAEYVRQWSEFDWLPGAKEALRRLREADWRVIVVSNQPGIARGAMTEEDLLTIHERMKQEAVEAGGWIDAIYYCPHGWDDGCECRKPRPGLLFQAQRDHSLDLSRTPFIGDDIRDRQAADAAGCPSIVISEEGGLLEVVTAMCGHATLGAGRMERPVDKERIGS
jgi:D-glycero-D-manno-heptose 1,7-bisphosphate phosphatase